MSLQQGDGAGTSSGTYTAAAGATLEFYGGNYELTGATAGVGGAGTVEDYAATVVVGAGVTFDPGALGLTGWGTLQLDTAGSTGSLNAVGGTRSGSGTLTVNGPMSVGSSGVVFKGGGTTTVTGASTINASTFNVIDGHTLNLGSTTAWNTGTIGVGGTGGATVNIGAGDTLNVTGDVSSGNWGGGLWNNQGTINRTTSTGAAGFDNAVENDGTINVSSGTLALKQGDGAGTERRHLRRGRRRDAELQRRHPRPDRGRFRYRGGHRPVLRLRHDRRRRGRHVQPGRARLRGRHAPARHRRQHRKPHRDQRQPHGLGHAERERRDERLADLHPRGSGTTSVGGTTTLNGSALYVLDGHTLNLGPTTELEHGDRRRRRTRRPDRQRRRRRRPQHHGRRQLAGHARGHWNNAGTINRTTSSGTAPFFRPVTSSGTINVHTGTLSFDSGLTQTAGAMSIDAGTTLGGAVALQGGVLKGAGTASGNVTNTGGTVAPGTSPGKLSIGGNYSQSAGTLEAQIAGTGQGTTYDWLAVAGSVAINGGTLAIVTDPQFDPAPADTFDIVTTGATQTASGTGFATVTGAALSGRSYAVHIIIGPPGKVGSDSRPARRTRRRRRFRRAPTRVTRSPATPARGADRPPASRSSGCATAP